MNNIRINFIPQGMQRYSTVGDYIYDDHGRLQVYISIQDDWREEAAIAIHELVEYFLCKHQKINIEDIDKFDFAFKEHDNIKEPGDDPQAPYYEAHQFALKLERMLIEELKLDWNKYDSDTIK